MATKRKKRVVRKPRPAGPPAPWDVALVPAPPREAPLAEPYEVGFEEHPPPMPGPDERGEIDPH